MTKAPTISRGSQDRVPGERGFTLIEMLIALVILLVAVMGVFGVFAFATKLNRGNSQRSQGLAVMQKEIELLRSPKFTPATVSNTMVHQHTIPACPVADDGSRDLTGATNGEEEYRCGIDRNPYRVVTTVDDDPFTAGTQTSATAALKEITIVVTPMGADGQWVNGRQIRMVFRRVRAN